MSDTWIEDWYKFKDARAMLEVAVAEALKAGMTQQEILNTISPQFSDSLGPYSDASCPPDTDNH